MRIKSFFFLLFIFLSCPLLRAQEVSVTLDEAIALGVRDNRDILLKTEEVKKAKLKISESNAGLLPSLTFTASQTDTLGLYAKDINQTQTQTTLKQYIYKGGKVINTIKYNGYNLEAAQAILDKAKIDAVLNIKKAFYTLCLSAELSGLNKNILENTKEHSDVVKERRKNGEASDSEALNMQASLDNVKKNYEESLNQVHLSEELLKNLVYLDREVGIKADFRFIYEARQVAYDQGFLKALETRPEIRQYEAQEKANKKAIEIAKADSRPNIYASWDYYSRSTSSLSFSPSKGWQDYNIAGVTFYWPVFDGWAAKAKVEQAVVDLKQTQLLRDRAQRDIALEVKNAYLSLKNAISKIQAAESDLALYKDNLAAVKEKYKLGIASKLDLSDADLKYNVADFNRKQAIYDYLMAESEFDKATGGL